MTHFQKLSKFTRVLQIHAESELIETKQYVMAYFFSGLMRGSLSVPLLQLAGLKEQMTVSIFCEHHGVSHPNAATKKKEFWNNRDFS